MFEERSAGEVDTLLKSNPEFRQLYQQHQELDRRVMNAELGINPVDDLDVIEANEAFAAQAIRVNRELGWNTDKVNVNGGAIAIGHPIGASGARILTTLLFEMKRSGAKKGLATLCIGGGMGVALAIESV